MANKFAPVLMALQETFAKQGGTPRTWDDTALIVEKVDDENGSIWYVDEQRLTEVLSDEDRDMLLEAGLLLKEGKAQRVVKGKTARRAVGVLMDALKRKTREQEQAASTVTVLQQKLRALERELKVARESNAADHALEALLGQVSEYFGGDRYKSRVVRPISRSKSKSNLPLAGVPTLMLSDWHWGEVVDPAQVEGLNEFNLAIAEKRAERVFSKTLDLLFRHQSGQTYDGIVVPLAGDMFAGNIHDELRQTNEAPILECILGLAQHLEAGLTALAQNFPWVYVPCVVGNHGRIDKKPTAKGKVRDNYDWMLYQMLERIMSAKFKDESNVRFAISPAADLPYSIYGTRYLLTHGDQFKSAGGVGGIFPGLMKTDYRKRKRSMQTGKGGYDRLLMGHWHQYGSLEGIIVNGSLKGIDEYAYLGNFSYEPPQQALWMTHPEYGVTSHMPILAEEPLSEDNARFLPPITCSLLASEARTAKRRAASKK